MPYKCHRCIQPATKGRYCDTHAKTSAIVRDSIGTATDTTKRINKPLRDAEDRKAQRKANRRIYSSLRWHKVRRIALSREPLCIACQMVGVVSASIEVDHIIPLTDGGKPYCASNHQALCKSCHSKKTRKEQAGIAMDYKNRVAYSLPFEGEDSKMALVITKG